MKTFADFGIEVVEGRGTEVSCQCPKCSPTRKKKHTKPLSANTEKGLWHCNHCGWAGSLQHGEQSQSDALERKARYSRPRYVDKEEQRPAELYEWFARRGIPRGIVQRNKITLGTAYMPQVEESIACIEFPYIKNGEVVNVKYRGLSEKCFRQHAGAEKVFYGLDTLAGTDTAVVVEGEVDKLSLEVAGLQGCLSVPDGAPDPRTKNYPKKFEFLENCQDLLASLTRIILAVDKDEPGKRLEDELVRRLGPERCYIVQWPEGCKDANDVLIKFGPAELASVIERAKPVPIEGVFEVADLAQEVMDLHGKRQAPGVSTGWPTLDQYFTVKPGEMTIITGIPSHGKSEWMDDLMVHLADIHGWPHGVFSPENFPVSNHVAKLIEKHTGKVFTSMTPHEVVCALEWAHQHFYFAVHGEETLNLDAILEKAHGMVKRYGIRTFLIDPWNEIDHAIMGDREDLYISRSLTKIRRFARKYGVHMFVIAHPQKLLRNKDGGYPVPTMYDISGGAHWRNKADNGIVVWRDVLDEESGTIIYIQKIKNRQNGKIGHVTLYWTPVGGRYLEQPRKLIGRQEGNQGVHGARAKQSLASVTRRESTGSLPLVGSDSEDGREP